MITGSGCARFPGHETGAALTPFWVAFLIGLSVIQGGLLFLDHHPMFFLGDSESYIWTAISGWLPPDRSFVYGYFIRLVALTTRSLLSLVTVQVLMLVIASAVMAYLLIRYFQVRPWIAYAVALLNSVEPLQALYARYVLTETLALFLFVVYLWIVFHYLEYPGIRWLVAMQCLATLMISVRFAFIPLAWISALLVPALGLAGRKPHTGRGGIKAVNRLAVHVVTSAVLLFAFTSAYQHLHGYMARKPPAYCYESGLVLMCFVLPIVDAGDFSDRALGELVLKDPVEPLAARGGRSFHRWREGGAVWRLKKLVRDGDRADAIARQAAMHAVIHKPLAFLGLGWSIFRDFLESRYLRECMIGDAGNERLSEGFHTLLRKWFGYPSDRSSSLELGSPTGRYFFASVRWIQILLFIPLGWIAYSVVENDGGRRRKCLFVALAATVFVGVSVFLVERPIPRFLHVPAWLFFPMAGLGLDRALKPILQERVAGVDILVRKSGGMPS
jgi:hypothetical protein